MKNTNILGKFYVARIFHVMVGTPEFRQLVLLSISHTLEASDVCMKLLPYLALSQDTTYHMFDVCYMGRLL